MDDVDAVQAQIAKTMLLSGDWVTARLDGVLYLEKAPLIYWLIAISYKIFGMTDWVARLPVALSAIALGLLTAAFGMWAFGKRAGFYAGLCVSTCVGLFLFTRVQIPDVMLTFTIELAMWAFLRSLDEEEKQPRLMGGDFCGEPGRRAVAEEPDCRSFSDRRSRDLSVRDETTLRAEDVAAAPAVQRRADRARGRCAVACAGHAAQSSLFRVDAEEWTWPISRIPVVLRDQRAVAALSESAVSARLQHGAAVVVLAVSSAVAFSLERVSPRDCETVFQAGRSRGTRTPFGLVPDRIHPGFLHILDHAGILFHAVLPSASAALRFGHGRGRRVDQERRARPRSDSRAGGGDHFRSSRLQCAIFPRPGTSRRH